MRHLPALVHRSCPDVALWLPHEVLTNVEGGRGHGLVLLGMVLSQVSPLGEHGCFPERYLVYLFHSYRAKAYH